MTQVFDIYTIGVPVTDQQRALDFYTDKLGLEKRADYQMRGGRRWIEVAPPRAAVTIALVPATHEVPTGVGTGIRLKTSDADADNSQLRVDGVDTDEVLRWPGVPPMFVFRDPDGNRLEIIEASAGER
ncbi:MAG TPA: VOC family protein [Chloroflexota bacterium]|nr:VOC family protein [Chloroflexota bacterium]